MFPSLEIRECAGTRIQTSTFASMENPQAVLQQPVPWLGLTWPSNPPPPPDVGQEFVAACLAPGSSWYLYTTPPKAELKQYDQSFYSAGFAPAVKLYLGTKAAGAAAAGGGRWSPRPTAIANRPGRVCLDVW